MKFATFANDLSNSRVVSEMPAAFQEKMKAAIKKEKLNRAKAMQATREVFVGR